MTSLTGIESDTNTLECNHHLRSSQSARHDGSERGNRRSVFLLTLDLHREMSGESTQRLRLEREEKKKKLSGMRDGTLIQGSSCARSPRGASGLHFPGRAAFVCARDQYIRGADTENLNLPGIERW